MRAFEKKFSLSDLLFIVYRLSVSVSADMEKFISVIYWYQPIRKLDLSAVIGIGRYGKKLIDRTLNSSTGVL